MSLDVSIIIPVNNEEPTLSELSKQLIQVLEAEKKSFEIIFVDDGSSDNSWQTLEEICGGDKRVRAIKLRKNFRKSAALSVGFSKAQGEIIVTIDGDLQDDPNEIPRLLAEIEQGFDLVSGWKVERQDDFLKVFASRVFNFFTSLLTGVKLKDFNNGLKAYRREVVQQLDIYGDLHRFIPAFASKFGHKVKEIPVKHHPRKFGESHFGGFRLLEGFPRFIYCKLYYSLFE